MRRSITLLTFLLLLSACKEYVDTPLSPAERQRVESAQLKIDPSPSLSLNIDVENQIRLLGLDLSTKSLNAGDKLIATFYLKALNDSMEDNQIFIHFQCRGRRGFHNLDGQSITRLHPLRKFKKGEIIADRIDFKTNQSCMTGQATLYWGLFRGADRLKFTNAKPNQISNDGRLKAATVTVKAKKVKLPQLDARQTQDQIVIDGQPSEKAWLTTTPINLTRIGGRAESHQTTQIRALYDAENLYLAIEAEDTDVWSTFTDRDSNTWEQEVVEIFIDALGNKRNYLELQVTPKNVIFDGRFSSHRSDLNKARSWNMKGLETAVSVNGTLNQREDKDKGYSVELKIPLTEVPGGLAAKGKGFWRINFFRFDMLKSKRQQASGWSHPPVPDFHHLESFGQLRFIP